MSRGKPRDDSPLARSQRMIAGGTNEVQDCSMPPVGFYSWKGHSLTARHLLTLFDSVYLSALSAWIGGAIFFTFVLAPILFKTGGSEPAVALIRAVYPRYFLGGAISGAAALASFVAGPLCYHEYRGPMVGVQAVMMICAILLMLYGANSLTPAICAASEADVSNSGQLKHLQHRTAGLNLVLLVIGLLLLAAHAARPAPRTSGIIELTPPARARYDAAINRVIEDAEVKYGFRPPRAEGFPESAATDPLIDEETVREVDSLYAKKRLREQARALKVRAKAGGTSP
jgi:uncharacterized membrane protein